MEYEYITIVKKVEVSALNKFISYLKDKDISFNTIADNTDTHVGHLCRVFKKERQLTDNLRIKLNEYLGTDF